MPVARDQPVYPPNAGEPVDHKWGEAVSEHVIQHFRNAADRDAKWSTPPEGAMCVAGQRFYVFVHGAWKVLAEFDSTQHSAFHSSGTIVTLRSKTDGQVGWWSSAGLLIQPADPTNQPKPAGGMFSPGDWAMLGPWGGGNDLAVWNNLRVQGGLYLGGYEDFHITHQPAGTPNVDFVDFGCIGNKQYVLRINRAQRVEGPFYQTVSSIRFKEQVEDFAPIDVRRIRVVAYTVKATGARALGVIAEELVDVLPDAVAHDEEGPRAVDYTQVGMATLAAVQDLIGRVEALESVPAAPTVVVDDVELPPEPLPGAAITTEDLRRLREWVAAKVAARPVSEVRTVERVVEAKDAEIAALRDQVASLSAALDRMSERLAALEVR